MNSSSRNLVVAGVLLSKSFLEGCALSEKPGDEIFTPSYLYGAGKSFIEYVYENSGLSSDEVCDISRQELEVYFDDSLEEAIKYNRNNFEIDELTRRDREDFPRSIMPIYKEYVIGSAATHLVNECLENEQNKPQPQPPKENPYDDFISYPRFIQALNLT